jgi:hypothetical protein
MTTVIRTERKTVAVPLKGGAQGPPGPPGSGSTIGVKDEGTTISSTVQRVNFTGLGAAVSGSGADVTVNIPGTGGLVFVTPQMFGAVADGTTDDSAAFVSAIAYLKGVAVNQVSTTYKSSPKLFVPAGHYYLGTTTLDITHTLIIEGEGGQGIGAGGGAATKLRWAAGATGIRIQATTTSGAGTVGASHFSGGFTTLRQLYLCGPSCATDSLSALSLTEGEYHGIHAKAAIFLDTVFVEGFQGDGLYAHTTSGAGDATEGSTNASRAYNCWFRGNRNGVSLFGADANVWTFIGCQATFNRACGVDEQSFLGNTHIGWHTAGNGVYSDNQGTTNFPAYVVSNGGNRYCPVQGQETAASTTSPSGTTDTATWLYMGAGGVATGYPAWTSGMHLRCAAPYRTNNVNAPNVFINPYEEGDQGFSQFVTPTIIQGGLHGLGAPKGTGLYIRNTNGGHLTIDRLFVPGMFQCLAGEIGFFGHSVNFQPNIGGSRGGNAALASLLTGLASIGLILDSTTA